MFGAYKAGDGFVVAFENGWAVSVRFGRGSYSATQYTGADEDTEMVTSRDAELALLHQGKIYRDVLTAVSTEDYAAIVQTHRSCEVVRRC